MTKGKITAIYHFEGMKRIEIQEAHAGDIVGLAGFEDVFIGETIMRHPKRASRCRYVPIDPPTIQMEFAVNDGPLAGQDGKLVTARHIWDRLVKEIRTNVALRIAQTERPENFRGQRPRRNADRHSRRADAPRRLRSAGLAPGSAFGKRTPTAICSSRLKNCSWKFPRKTWATIMENLAGRKARDHQHEPSRQPGYRRGAGSDARLDRF